MSLVQFNKPQNKSKRYKCREGICREECEGDGGLEGEGVSRRSCCLEFAALPCVSLAWQSGAKSEATLMAGSHHPEPVVYMAALLVWTELPS